MSNTPSRPVMRQCIAAVALWSLLAPANAAAGDRIKDAFVGTYLWLEDESFQRVAAISADGSFSTVSQAGPAFGFTDGLGSVERSGKRELTATQIDFNFDADGNPTGVSRVVFVMTFSEKRRGKFQRVQGSLVGETFAPETDPLDPASVPSDSFTFDYIGQRVNID